MDSMFFEMVSAFAIGIFIGGGLFLLYFRLGAKKRDQSLKKEADMILNRAKSQAAKIERSGKQKAREWEEKEAKKLEQELKSSREKLRSEERWLKKRQDQLETGFQIKEEELKKATKVLEQNKELLQVSQKQVQNWREKLKKEKEESSRFMEKLALMSKEEAREHLKKALEEEVRQEMEPKLNQMEEEMKQSQAEKARLLLAQAMARYSAEVTAERTVESLPISGAAGVTGKIIGREGRNIKALEAATGVDLIISEGEETITISCFDPVRRAIARKTLEKLMEEGRVHPAFVEEVVEKTRRAIFSDMQEEGKKICFDMGIHKISQEIVKVLGRLKYRFIEGQNLLKYSTEVAYISSLLAGELGTDKKQACRAGLLHAIGLGVPHFVEGSYAYAGSQFCQKQGEEKAICQAILCHNEQAPAQSLLDHVLQCAYNLSRSRAGAKRSMLDSYINRLKDLESIANSFEGVKRSFVLKAGHEVRVLVDSFKVTDENQMRMLSRDIAKKIQREIKLHEEVKVSLIREYRIVEHAR